MNMNYTVIYNGKGDAIKLKLLERGEFYVQKDYGLSGNMEGEQAPKAPYFAGGKTGGKNLFHSGVRTSSL